MINFIKTLFFTFTIWIVAALINGFLYAIVFCLGNIVRGGFIGNFVLAFIFSCLYSVPAAFFLWIVFLANSSKENFTKILLGAAFILSLLSSLLIQFLPTDVCQGHWFLLVLTIVVSSLLSVLLHHRFLKSFYHSNSSTNV